MPWIKYHLLIINNKKHNLLIIVVSLLLLIALFYLANGFESVIERALNEKAYLINYTNESFELIRLFIVIMTLFMSKEVVLTEDYLVRSLTKKRTYYIHQYLTMLGFYLVICIIFYFIFQLVGYALYSQWLININYLSRLVTNAWLIHCFVLLFTSRSNHLFVSLVLMMGYFLLMRLFELNHWIVQIIRFILPLEALDTPFTNQVHAYLVIMLYLFFVFLRQTKEI
ncbi:MAG TPA: hypothetical protein DEA45_01045 [Acholeplasmataceae bacterium]|nr:hypothetical protein [Acholeplasmataceae bacterium]